MPVQKYRKTQRKVRTCGVRAYLRTVGAPASLARSGAEPSPIATLSREIEKRREHFLRVSLFGRSWCRFLRAVGSLNDASLNNFAAFFSVFLL